MQGTAVTAVTGVCEAKWDTLVAAAA